MFSGFFALISHILTLATGFMQSKDNGRYSIWKITAMGAIVFEFSENRYLYSDGGSYYIETSPLVCSQINGLVSIW